MIGYAIPDVYEYDDFRLFLRDCYGARKRADPKDSYRKFAIQAGFTNPGYFNDVVRARRRLSRAALEKMVTVFKLKPQEAEYFTLLVHYGQSKKSDERDKLYQQILFRRSRSSFTRLNPSLVRYYQDYRYPLVRSAIEVKDFRGNYESLAKFFNPPIPAAAVKKIVRDLCEWKLVEQLSDGRYAVTDRFVEPPATMGHLIRQLNREWVEQAKESITRFGPEERHASSMLMGISRETHAEVRRRLEAFRKEIFELIKNDDRPELLGQLSLIYFPKSTVEVKNGNR